MGPSDAQSLYNLLDKGGVLGLLVALTAGLIWTVRWLVKLLLEQQRTALLEMKEERDAWRAIALAGQNTAQRSVTIAEQQVGLTR